VSCKVEIAANIMFIFSLTGLHF